MPLPRLSARSIRPALDAAGFVGTWDWSVTTGAVVLDPGSARIVAGDPALAGRAIDLDTALARLHADDRGWVEARIREAARTCGTIMAEYRIQEPDGTVRWLLDRGSVARQRDGTVRGRGIWLDVTDIHRAAAAEDEGRRGLSLAAVTDHCLRAREQLRRGGRPVLQLLLDMVLLELGRDLTGPAGGSDRRPLH